MSSSGGGLFGRSVTYGSRALFFCAWNLLIAQETALRKRLKSTYVDLSFKLTGTGLGFQEVYCPVPATGTSCGLPPTFSVTARFAARWPLAVGLKTALMVQVPPAGTLVPQVLVCEKSAGLVPVYAI